MDENALHLWVIAAQNDYAATQELQDEEVHSTSEVICFHAQQAAEKILKAYLVFFDEAVPNEEKSCTALLDMLQSHDPEVKKLKSDAELLNEYGSADQGWGIVEIPDDVMARVITSTEHILDYVEEKLKG